jgi:hypothetical protein
MVNTFEINEDYLSHWKDENDRENIRKKLSTLIEEFDIPVYCEGTEYFLNCFKGYENAPSVTIPEDYGYGLTFKALNKYLKNHYGEYNRNEYIITVGMIPIDYDKIYKCGEYIDLNGNNTGDDYYNTPDFDPSNPNDSSKADIENNFLSYQVFLLKTN